MFLFERSCGIEIRTEGEPSIDAIKNELYHQLYRSGAFAEKTDDGITFKQDFFSSMARKPIAGISFGRIIIERTENGISLKCQLKLKNYLIGSMLCVAWLAGIQWYTEGKLASAIIYLSFWAVLFAVIHIISHFEFKGFLRRSVMTSSTSGGSGLR